VIRPRLATWIDVAADAAAAVALAVSLDWLGLALPAGMVAGLVSVAVCRFMAGRGGNASALLVARDGAFHVRLPQGWLPLELQRAWRGPRCLTLRGRIPAAACNAEAAASAGADRYVTLTLWQDALGQSAWRRACLLSGRRMRRVASRSVAEPV
jgi:hypothetical protein